MFTIRTSFSDQFEVKVSREKVHKFFSDIRNFIELMPNVESINASGDGSAHWRIGADIPFIGAMRQAFMVELAENSDERIEWIPKAGEKQNFLRYAADFIEKSSEITIVRFSQDVELRRNSARELHLLAGLAGESRVSKGMQAEVAGMIRNFVSRAKQRLENSAA
jgi:carbon monoxide dehydrogenase subunit G